MRYKKSGIVDVEYGGNVVIVEPVNLYGCKLGDDVKIGPFVEIQKGVLVGSNTKIQSHTFICEMVSIGSNCFIGHGVVFVNDLFSDGFPASGDRSKWLPTNIGDFVQIGSNSTILPVNICSQVVVGAGSVVTKDIIEPGFYVGNPAKKLRG